MTEEYEATKAEPIPEKCSHQWYPNDISEDVTVFTCTKCGESQ